MPGRGTSRTGDGPFLRPGDWQSNAGRGGAFWHWRIPIPVGLTLPKTIRDIAWKAQVRLCGRYRRLNAAGKKRPVIIAAIACEMAAFLWAIGRQITPAPGP